MNHTEYVEYMADNDLIESLESVRCLANAMQLQKNIRNIKGLTADELNLYKCFDLDPKEMLNVIEKEKAFYVKRATEKAFALSFAKEMFHPIQIYELQIKELMKITIPTVSSIGI